MKRPRDPIWNTSKMPYPMYSGTRFSAIVVRTKANKMTLMVNSKPVRPPLRTGS